MNNDIHIFAPPTQKSYIERQDCPTCAKKRFFIVHTYEWFAPTYICVKCGETWHGDEMQERPFCRGWRKDSVSRAKQYYRKIMKRMCEVTQ